MPSDVIIFTIATGVGVSVAAGIISGFCYILSVRAKPKNRKWHCKVCGVYLRSTKGLLCNEKVVICSKCGAKVCEKCTFPHMKREWICQSCHSRGDSSWAKGILDTLSPLSKVLNRTDMEQDRSDDEGEVVEVKKKKEKEQVRDFIERLIAVMLGGNVDDASVNRIYNDPRYLPTTGDSPCTAHAALKDLIKKIIKEALDLPQLQKPDDGSIASTNDSTRTYEELLSTAILNKVITDCQNNRPSSSANSVSSRHSISSKYRDDKEYFFGDQTLDDKWKDFDTTSVSSLEEWVQTDSSLGSTKYVDKVSLTIQQCIEEITPSDSDEDEVDHPRSSSVLDDDDSNWYLKKRQLYGTASPVPVPMLVPNPTTEAKVLIGDREVDDTSDLSDVASDYGDMEAPTSLNNLLVESKTVIGGKNLLLDLKGHVSDDEISADSGVRDEASESNHELDNRPSADRTIDDDNVEDASLLSIYSNTEKDSEYTERYASLPRTMVKESSDRKRKIEEDTRNENESSQNTEISEIPSEKVETGDLIDANFPGRYSKKEKEKWGNAIEMKNNPYSKENIEKRLKYANTLSIFNADYYVRQASRPRGGKEEVADEDFFRRLENGPSDISNTEPSNEVNNNLPLNDEPILVRATPILLEQNTEDNSKNDEYVLENNKINDNSESIGTKQEDSNDWKIENEEIVPKLNDSIDSSNAPDEDFYNSEITSDSDLSFVNCYDVTQSVVYRRKSDSTEVNIIFNEEELESSLEDNKTTDENHNKNETNSNSKRDETYDDKKVSISEDESKTVLNNEDIIISNDVKETISTDSPLPVSNELIHSDDVKEKTPPDSKIVEEIIKPNAKPRLKRQFKQNEENKAIDQTIESLVINSAISSCQEQPKYRQPISYERETSISEFDQKPTILTKKSDNTLIKKIYSIPNVRTFALESRERLPIEFEPKTPPSSPAEPKFNATNGPKSISPNFTHSRSNSHNSDIDDIEIVESINPDVEVEKVAAVVINRLGLFSKSSPNLETFPPQPLKRRKRLSKNLDDLEDNYKVSVRDLRKIFERFEMSPKPEKPSYSLTGRSISKQMRESLKNQETDGDGILQQVEAISPRIMEVEIEEPEQMSAVERIRFYENLRR